MIPILGKNIILYMTNNVGAAVRIGCARTVKRKAVREMKETSDSTTGRFRKYIAGMIDQTLSVSGLMGFSNGSQYDSSVLYDKLVAIGTNQIQFQYQVYNGTYTDTYTGNCLVASFEESRQYNDVGAYDVELQVVGEVTKTTTGTYLPYYWLTSSTQLTADQVKTAIQAGTANGVTAPSFATITINFGAPGGKWLYFAIPSTSPDRLSFYVSVGDQGRIGQTGDLFNYDIRSITVGSVTANYKVYQSNVSKVNNSPMDLRTFFPTSGGIIGYGTTIYQQATAPSSGTSYVFSALAGVPLNKLIILMRGNTPFTSILASPASPNEGGCSYDGNTGTITVPADNAWIGESLTAIYLS